MSSIFFKSWDKNFKHVPFWEMIFHTLTLTNAWFNETSIYDKSGNEIDKQTEEQKDNMNTQTSVKIGAQTERVSF